MTTITLSVSLAENALAHFRLLIHFSQLTIYYQNLYFKTKDKRYLKTLTELAAVTNQLAQFGSDVAKVINIETLEREKALKSILLTRALANISLV